MLKSAAAAFLGVEAPVAALRRLRDASTGLDYDKSLWCKIADQGWQGILIDEIHDGSNFGLVGAAVVCEEMGRCLTAAPLVAALMASVAMRQAVPTLAKLWLPRIATGKAILVCAVDEGRKHAPDHITLSTTRTTTGWVLNGIKSAIPDGDSADGFIVAARSSNSDNPSDGISLFLVEAQAAGVITRRVTTADSRSLTALQFEGVEVTREQLIGPLNRGFPALDAVLDVGRLAIAAELSGIAQEVFARTLDYLKQRKQFGRPLSSNQALQHRMSHLYSEIEVLKSVVLAAAQAGEVNLHGAKLLISAAKAKAVYVSRLAVSEAVQLHGGIGMTDELDIGLFMKRARVAAELWGDEYFHLNRFADMEGF
ncbi:acyl-CoA dehydrogenase family protein [Caballeronia sp. SEWSISQ10-4 2]|nr:acyl-CoA dehydrogenase family protein [Caballeronia sp. SEWSISQ10-4 2]